MAFASEGRSGTGAGMASAEASGSEPSILRAGQLGGLQLGGVSLGGAKVPGSPARFEARLESWELPHCTVWQVSPHKGGECFLVQSEGQSVLFDTGFAYCAPQTYENIVYAQNGAPVDWLVLTHSHYDHASAAGYLRERMPSMRVAASAHAARVFERPGAITTMRELNDERAHDCGVVDYEDVADALAVDRVLAEGDTFSVGALEFRAMEAVGHTKCSVAFFAEEEGLLVSCETAGVYDPRPVGGLGVPGHVKFMVEIPMLVACQSCLDFIDRASKLGARYAILPHTGLFAGEAVGDYFEAAAFWARYLRDTVVAKHRAGESLAEILAWHRGLFYTSAADSAQPAAAFDLNASYAIPMIIRECCGEEAA